MKSLEDIKQLYGDKIAVEIDKVVEQKRGGLYVPASVIDKQANRGNTLWRGKVILIGDGVTDKLKIKVGDNVLGAPVARDCPKLEIDEKKYVLMSSEDIYIVEKELENGKN